MLLWRGSLPTVVGVALLIGLAPWPGLAAGDGERFAVRNAWVELGGDTWQLAVSLDLGLGPAAREALASGVPLTLRLEAEASSERRLLPDAELATAGAQWLLEYDALAGRYVVTDLGQAASASHATLDEALDLLARPPPLPLADSTRLPPDRRFDVRVRAVLEIGDVPAAVRVLLFWRSFSAVTEWYSWTVRP